MSKFRAVRVSDRFARFSRHQIIFVKPSSLCVNIEISVRAPSRFEMIGNRDDDVFFFSRTIFQHRIEAHKRVTRQPRNRVF